MSKSVQTSAQKNAANAADNWLVDALVHYRRNGVPEREDIKSITDNAKRQEAILLARGKCDALIIAANRRIANRSIGKGTSVTDAFMAEV